MKFDVVVGNPPYQGEVVGEKTSPPSVYNFMMDQAFSISDIICLITPARFLFNTGRTPKKWNKKMLSDIHFKVIEFFPDSSFVFSNTDIKGGVVITYRDNTKNFGEIGTFSPYKEMNGVLSKVSTDTALDSIILSQASYKFSPLLHSEIPKVFELLSVGNEDAVGTGVFKQVGDLVFHNDKPRNIDGTEYIELYGLLDLQRVSRWINLKYIMYPRNLFKWKVLVPQANGSGIFGETLSSPFVVGPGIGHTQTFISIGSFDFEEDASNCLKYIKTKFSRSLLGVNKITQHNPPRTWSKIPLQDFTVESNIDWNKSIPEIDQQLYKKYSLSEEEIKFIESNVKEMD